MKKFLSILLVLAMVCSMSLVALAAGEAVITYDLSVGGEHDVVVKTGDIITVTYKLSASKECRPIGTQNEIFYDHNFFQLVEGTNKPATGMNYNTSQQTSISGSHYVFFNTMATYTYNTTPTEIGTFQLKVIATSGESTVASTSAMAVDNKNALLGSNINDLHVSIDAPQTPKYTVTFKGIDNAVLKTEVVEKGQSVTVPKAPDREEGYTFTHWTCSVDNVKYQAGDRFTPSSDVTFTPNWSYEYTPVEPEPEVEYTVTFETNGGANISPITRPEGSIVNLNLYLPEKEGYVFDGWYTNKSLTTKVEVMLLTGNTTVYAKWIEGEDVWENPFNDVRESDWFYEDVKFVEERSLMNGVSGGRFDPYGTLTRAMVVTTLYRMEGEPASNKANPFTDVAAGQWYTDAVVWAADEKIVEGYGKGRFGPNDPVTREQLAAILQRYARYMGCSISASTGLNADAVVSNWALGNVKWAVAEDILVDGKSVNATKAANRAEVAHALHFFLVNVAD